MIPAIVRSLVMVSVLVVLLPACASEDCGPPPELDAGVDAPMCAGRVVLGPVMIGGLVIGFGNACSLSAGLNDETYPMRVHLFRAGTLVRTYDVGCDSTDYIDLGFVEPGAYVLAVEGRGGSDLNAGTELLRPPPCLEDGIRPEWCYPIPLLVRSCDLHVVPLWLHCGAEGCGVPR